MARARPQRTQQERSQATTGELLDAARELFAAEGYAATSLEDVVQKAGVTKGALYHHFRGKRELFLAVFEQEHQGLMKVVEEAYRRKRDHWQGFHAACRAFFEASLDPGVQRIALLEAPGVLGWEEVRTVEWRYSLAYIKLGVERAIDQGYIDSRPVEPLAHFLFGGLCEGSMFVARSDNPEVASRRVLKEVRTLLDALLIEKAAIPTGRASTRGNRTGRSKAGAG